MAVLEYHTAGESHGPGMIALVQGLPAGVRVDLELIDAELRRRQGGYGRGGRQRIETDSAEVIAGVRQGETIGSPVVLRVINKDSRLDDAKRTPPVSRPRPGHADLAGSIKWLTTDCRSTLERASARETAARVAAGALARCLLRELGVEVFGIVRSVRDVVSGVEVTTENWKQLREARDASEVYCPDAAASAAMIDRIHAAKVDKDTVGGLVEAHVFGVPPGFGSCVDWREKLDARLAFAVMGIQAIKAVEIGLGKAVTERSGSAVHDPIAFDRSRIGDSTLGFVRPTNNAGGVEGGMSNGQPVVVRAAMKPISTLLRGLPSVDLNTKSPEHSDYERSDVCAVSAASVVVENVVAFEIARAILIKVGGDSIVEVMRNWSGYLEMARALPLDPPVATLA